MLRLAIGRPGRNDRDLHRVRPRGSTPGPDPARRIQTMSVVLRAQVDELETVDRRRRPIVTAFCRLAGGYGRGASSPRRL